MDKSGYVVLEARKHVGLSCYVWGARGQVMNTKSNLDSWLIQRETADDTHTKNENIARVKAMYAKLKSKGVQTIRGFDCSGFTYYVFSQCGLMTSRMNAASYYSKCTKISNRSELHAGDLVFRHNGKKISHVGIYIGDGRVIHCKGRDVGVIEEPIAKYSWNRYGRWPGVYDASGGSASSGTTGGDTPASGGSESYVLTLGSLNVRTGSGTSFKSIGIVRKNTKLPYLGTDTAGEKWYKVTYKGQTAYITSKPRFTRLS